MPTSAGRSPSGPCGRDAGAVCAAGAALRARSFSRRRRGAAGLAWRGSAAAGGLRGSSVSRVDDDDEEEDEEVARRGRKRRLKREESGRRKRAPKHSVSRPERKSRKRNFCGSRSPNAAGQPGIPGSFRGSTMGRRIAADGWDPPPPPPPPPQRRAQGRGAAFTGPHVGGCGERCAAGLRRCPEVLRAGGRCGEGRRRCPRGRRGAERRLRVPPPGMKAAGSASRGGRRTAASRLGSRRGAGQARSRPFRRWVHAAAFLRGGEGEERKSALFPRRSCSPPGCSPTLQPHRFVFAPSLRASQQPSDRSALAARLGSPGVLFCSNRSRRITALPHLCSPLLTSLRSPFRSTGKA